MTMMRRTTMAGRVRSVVVLLAGLACSAGVAAQMAPMAKTEPMAPMTKMDAVPAVGQKAPDFTLTSLDGATVRLADEVAAGPVALIVLRGFPTYQCPFCTRQFADYLAHGDDFQASGAHVLFVYPGDPEGLNDHAAALVAGRPMPANYKVLMDPDYTFTLAYHLRWDAPKETAYPSTFVIDRKGLIVFAKTSHVHADRVPTADVLKVLAEMLR
jgi:peroxiredoxin